MEHNLKYHLINAWFRIMSPIRRIKQHREDHYVPTFTVQEATLRIVLFLERLRKEINEVDCNARLGVCRLVKNFSPDTEILNLNSCNENERIAKTYEALKNIKHKDLPVIEVIFYTDINDTFGETATKLNLTPFNSKHMWLNAHQMKGKHNSHAHLNYQVHFRPEPDGFIKLQDAIFTAILKNPNLTFAQCETLNEMWKKFDKKNLPLPFELLKQEQLRSLGAMHWREPAS